MKTGTEKPVLAVLGPTASGKTALAIAIARQFNCEIVNCDSRQIYTDMYIGTACPSESEKREVVHHLFNFVSPSRSFSAADYAEAASECIRGIWQRGRIPLLTGGTGFYYSAIAEGLGDAGHDPLRAEQLRKMLDQFGNAHMIEHLLKLDPQAAAVIDTSNPRRVLRAIEIVETTGRPFAMNVPVKPLPESEFLPIVVTRPRPFLHAAIARRVDSMISNGLEAEVRTIVDRFGGEAAGLGSIGYQEWLPCFEGKASHAEVREQIIIHTRQYAKRQETWFRRRPGVGMLDLSDPQQSSGIFPQIAAFVGEFGL